MPLKSSLKSILLIVCLAFNFGFTELVAASDYSAQAFPLADDAYEDAELMEEVRLGQELTLLEVLTVRAKKDPFNVVATIIFFLAIGHTFIAGGLLKKSHEILHEHEAKVKSGEIYHPGEKDPVSFKATLFHFLGEVEAVFGLWLLPLFAVIIIMKGGLGIGWATMTHYVDTRNFVEPMVVVVLMAIASSRPIVQSAERNVSLIAGLGGHSPAAYWFSILTITPVLGSFITEPAAMTIAAILLGQQFYKHNPNSTHKYATLGLLFVNISVGGTLTHFAAPPVLMVAGEWNWDIAFMFTNFGWKAVIGILVANCLYFFVFRKSFRELKAKVDNQGVEEDKEDHVPVWISVIHFMFLAWTILVLHHPALFIGGFLFFIAFTMATDHHQFNIQLKGPMLVGFFLAGLIVHGGLQGWWISPVLSSLGEIPLFLGSTILTAFNDNAAITYLASQVPLFGEAESAALRYAVVAGAVAGGGLTVIANAPNPAGQSLLSKYFDGGISPLKLLFGSLVPTVIMVICFMVL